MAEQKRASQIRSQRKEDHVNNFHRSNFERDQYFDDIYLIHQSLPEIDFDTIDTKTVFLGKEINFPLMINAMTGGFDGAMAINKALAQVAKALNLPMAVGSQSIAVKDADYSSTFKIVRETIGNGPVVGNLSGFATTEEADIAVTMLEADGLQIHLNPAQEICMPEGDRNFSGVLRRIEAIVHHLDVPVIVKEVGFGINKQVAKALYDIGVQYVDVAGSGGTNFIQIEDERNTQRDYREMYQWGNPTALSLIECAGVEGRRGLTASGGIASADQVVKSLVIGADMVGMSGPVLRQYLDHGQEGVYEYLSDIIHKSRVMMLLQGASDIETLKKSPFRVTGHLRELLEGYRFGRT